VVRVPDKFRKHWPRALKKGFIKGSRFVHVLAVEIVGQAETRSYLDARLCVRAQLWVRSSPFRSSVSFDGYDHQQERSSLLLMLLLLCNQFPFFINGNEFRNEIDKKNGIDCAGDVTYFGIWLNTYFIINKNILFYNYIFTFWTLLILCYKLFELLRKW
jgi:hypothetical protein